MNSASILEVEEALLAVHVVSNGSQESTNPNCSFRLQDPRGIQGLEGRFRVRTRRDRHHAQVLRTGRDDNDMLVPPRWHARAHARPPLCTLRA